MFILKLTLRSCFSVISVSFLYLSLTALTSPIFRFPSSLIIIPYLYLLLCNILPCEKVPFCSPYMFPFFFFMFSCLSPCFGSTYHSHSQSFPSSFHLSSSLCYLSFVLFLSVCLFLSIGLLLSNSEHFKGYLHLNLYGWCARVYLLWRYLWECMCVLNGGRVLACDSKLSL